MKKLLAVFVVFAVVLGGLFFFTEFKTNTNQGQQVESDQEMNLDPEQEQDPKKKKGWGPDYSGISVKRIIKKDQTLGEGDRVVKKNSKVEIVFEMYVYAPARPANKGRLIEKTDPGKTSTFRLGKNKLIPGWEEGMLGMREGGKRELIIPPDKAWGEEGIKSKVPPGAIIYVITELKKIL